MGFENAGRVWTPNEIAEYLGTLERPDWVKGITLHHCAEPSLRQRPVGLIKQHIANIQSFYSRPKSAGGKGWKTGPHFFTDEDQIWGLCDPRVKGIHAASFNGTTIGIEVLGDYDAEDPKAGRGLQCWETTATLVVALLNWLDLKAVASEKSKPGDTILFHRDDKQTTKTCPGKLIQKAWVLALIEQAAKRQFSSAPVVSANEVHDKPETPFPWTEWMFNGGRWCVPVMAFLLKRGKTSAEITANMKRTDDGVFYGNDELEGAFYNGPTSATWAPVRELLPL